MKTTLLAIKRFSNHKRTEPITTKDISRLAGLPVADVFALETGGSTTENKAIRIVTAFNCLSGMHVGLEELKVSFIQPVTPAFKSPRR